MLRQKVFDRSACPAKLEFRHDQLLSSVVILGLYHVVIYGVLNVGLGNQQLILVIGKDVP